MSLRVLALAVRDTLRSDLTNFYDNDDSLTQSRLRIASCRVMPNERPAPSAGEEFVAVYGSAYRPRTQWLGVGIEEEFGVTVAVTRRISLTPQDARGEAGYLRDFDAYDLTWKSIEDRCREITGLIDKNYVLLRAAEALFPDDSPQNFGFSEPLVWAGTDAMPQLVDASHFSSYHTDVADDSPLPGIPEADDQYGLLMRVRFDRAIRLQANTRYDTT